MVAPSERVRAIQGELARRARTTQSTPERAIDHLVFFLAEERYAIPVLDVEEVLRVPTITPIPGVHPAVLGAVGHHGEVLAVVDTRRLLQLPEQPLTSESRLVVVRTEEAHAALLVDRVEDIVAVPEGSLRPRPPAGSEGAASCLRAISGDGAQMLRILDLASLLGMVRHG
jgi:purine-binding chemotaxis protein CheW